MCIHGALQKFSSPLNHILSGHKLQCILFGFYVKDQHNSALVNWKGDYAISQSLSYFRKKDNVSLQMCKP